MTCVIGLVKHGVVYMGGDSAAATDWETRSVDTPTKVFKKGPFLIGYTTSFRMGQILMHYLDVPPKDPADTDVNYMVTVFVEAVRKLLEDYGYTHIENNTESGGQFLVGYKRRLYEVQSDFSVLSYKDGYTAIGSGYMYALGAMAVLCDTAEPDVCLYEALGIAGYFNKNVRGPFVIRAIEAEDVV